MKIYLIGYMGCGKSTLGKSLAKKMMLDFIDLDTYIEKKTNMSVSEIFEVKGENFFRGLESECLQEIALRDNVVVATGGGAPLYNNNLEFMNKNGLTIYLKVNSGILSSRLATAKVQRPLLKDKTPEQLKEFIDQMLQQREPFYNNAMIVVEGKNITVTELIDRIKKW